MQVKAKWQWTIPGCKLTFQKWLNCVWTLITRLLGRWKNLAFVTQGKGPEVKQHYGKINSPLIPSVRKPIELVKFCWNVLKLLSTSLYLHMVCMPIQEQLLIRIIIGLGLNFVMGVLLYQCLPSSSTALITMTFRGHIGSESSTHLILQSCRAESKTNSVHTAEG